MRAWIDERGYAATVELVESPPAYDRLSPGPVIVINAARDHEAAATSALCAGHAVLVEKPMAMSAAGARRLIDAARHGHVRLASSGILLFADYMQDFARLAKRQDAWSSVSIEWTDPAAESRYGEDKTYDAGLPVIADVGAHIVAILELLLPGVEPALDAVDVQQGGMKVALDLRLGDLPCRVVVGRNQAARCRRVAVRQSDATLELDFTREPGTVCHRDRQWSADPAWSGKPSPLTRQIRSFLSGGADERISPALGLKSCRLVDACLDAYDIAQKQWIRDYVASGRSLTEAAPVYAAVELASRADPTRGPLDGRDIETVLKGI